MQANPAAQHDERHFAVELAGLVIRIVATAIAINIVLGGVVLALAGQAHAATTPSAAADTADIAHEMHLARSALTAAPAPTALTKPIAPSAVIEPLFIVLHRYAYSQPLCDRSASPPPQQAH